MHGYVDGDEYVNVTRNVYGNEFEHGNIHRYIYRNGDVHMMIAFIVPGEPQGKARPRFGKGRVYTPEKTISYEELIQFSYKRIIASGKAFVTTKPIEISIDAYYRIPQKTNSETRRAMIDRKVLPSSKPDVDNIAKVVMDALNKLAYDDDKQVVCLCVRKFYADEPQILVRIREMET